MPKATFNRIAEEKQHMILDVAAAEFAEHGYHKANINTIAAKAGISIGSMYKYFHNKKDLCTETLFRGIYIIQEYYGMLDAETKDPFEHIRKVFENSVLIVEKYTNYMHLYMNIITVGIEDFSVRYAREIEAVGSNALKSIIKDGITNGYIDPEIDVDKAALFLDNQLLMFIFSQISLYLKLRQETFLEKDTDPHHLIDATVDFCRKILAKNIPSGD